ncbi:hypothetical protein NIES2111_38160 [Nostoc sp. NIES-2111]|nr:hypothetical protein NIES2111_38160 [Nostoc sp. NIES-2111]
MPLWAKTGSEIALVTIMLEINILNDICKTFITLIVDTEQQR